MKVLLISQPDRYRKLPDFPSLGIGYLDAVAHKAGHKVLLIDGGLHSIAQIVAEAEKFEPDIIGITCWTIGRSTVWKLCDSLKKVLSVTFLVIGGPHASIYPEYIFKKTHASAIVLGEGDETFIELIITLSNISSRGYIFNCSYCASVRYWGRKWRFRSAENVLAEILYNSEATIGDTLENAFKVSDYEHIMYS